MPQMFFNLTRRPKRTPAVAGKAFLNLLQGVVRLYVYPLCGGILFFQGWRMDPIMQFGAFLLGLALILESSASVASDYKKWKERKGKARQRITTNNAQTDTNKQ